MKNLAGEYNNNKAQWNDLAFKILGTQDEHADEFEKANIVVKTIRIEENNNMRESMSFPPFKFLELIKGKFMMIQLFMIYFEETSIFFLYGKKMVLFIGCRAVNYGICRMKI